MREELEKKVAQAVKLIQSMAPKDGSPLEVAYSGGKDSDVILQLTKEAGVAYRAIYKNTTIDPPGTVAHAKEMGAEVMKPKKTFWQLLEDNGYPNRFMRFCCKFLKEYKVLDRTIMGVRRAESTKRANRYNEPTECRFYGNKREHVQAIYPILEWTDEDVRGYIEDRGIKCAPVYYDEYGVFHVERRLGCLCCPLQSRKKRIEQFRKYPGMVRQYIKHNRIYRENHPDIKSVKMYPTAEEQFVRDVFFDNQSQYLESKKRVV